MKRAFVTVFAAILLLCSACSSKHYTADNIGELYDRTWIIGRSRAEITEKYGAFSREFTDDNGKELGAYYVNYENRGIGPSYIHDTYFILFDTNDFAIDAYFAQTSIGG